MFLLPMKGVVTFKVMLDLTLLIFFCDGYF